MAKAWGLSGWLVMLGRLKTSDEPSRQSEQVLQSKNVEVAELRWDQSRGTGLRTQSKGLVQNRQDCRKRRNRIR